MSDRQQFSSGTATILTMVGVSIGLGNVWRFPYMMGRYGGSAFLLLYLLFTVCFAVPAVMAEWSLGRHTRSGPLGAFRYVFGRRWGSVVGYVLLVTVLIANSYYLVVIGNVVFAAYTSIVQGFNPDSIGRFGAGLNNGPLQYVITLTILCVSLLVIHRGLNNGIESVSKLFVPFFGAVALLLVVNAFALDGATPHIAAFLRPDFAAMTPANIFAALGQAFFSVGLGGTFLLIYGSYLRADERLPKAALTTALGDAGAALLAALFIVPSVLVFGIDLDSGPRLIFSTLPELFVEMSGGRIVGSFFLVSLAMVAFLSNLAALEVLVGGLSDGWKAPPSRVRLILSVGLAEAVLVLPSAFDAGLIGILDLVFGSGMQVLGSVLAVVAVAWGLGRQKGLQEIFGGVEGRWQKGYFFWIKWVLPGALLSILVLYIYTSVSG